jgi:hypothetical protein
LADRFVWAHELAIYLTRDEQRGRGIVETVGYRRDEVLSAGTASDDADAKATGLGYSFRSEASRLLVEEANVLDPILPRDGIEQFAACRAIGMREVRYAFVG